jgi:uncharacterized damage-inducible protein DinB
MTTASQPQQTIGDQMPWYGMTMDYTEKVCELITEELWRWRPENPQGSFQASLGEITMHCADERHFHAQLLSGTVDERVFFGRSPDKDGIGTFREGVSREEALASLRAGRELLDKYARLPAERLMEVTEGAKTSYRRQIASAKEQAIDTTQMDMRGAPTIFRVLMAVACHEAGHRGTLYTLLRLNGVSLPAAK